MAQIPSGFTFNDDITEDASERFPPPALGSTSINWNDAGSVYDAIQKVSEQFKQAFADLIDQSAKGTDNSDVKTVHDAQIQANKTGRPVRVHLKDADVDAIISVQPIKEEDFHAERAA